MAAVIPLIGAAISAIPAIFSAIAGAQKVKTVSKMAVNISNIAQGLVKDYFKYSKDLSIQDLESEFQKIDARKLADLAKLEAKFNNMMLEMGVTVDLKEYELAIARIKLLEQDIKTESFFQRGWRPSLFWTGIFMIILQGPVAIILGAISFYYPDLAEISGYLRNYNLGQWWELMTVAVGVGIASRTVEKFRNRGEL